MKLTFNINYITNQGEDIRVNIKQNDGTYKQYILLSPNGADWSGAADVKPSGNEDIEYYYTVNRMQTELRREWQMIPHRINIACQEADAFILYDMWCDVPMDSFLYSSAFTQCMHRREREAMPKHNYSRTMCLKVRAPQLRKNESLWLSGSVNALGSWDVSKAVRMYEGENNEWFCHLNVGNMTDNKIWYKFIIKKEGGTECLWEKGNDRVTIIPQLDKAQTAVVEVTPAYFEIRDQKFAGTAVPVFSLRSKKSFGVGDFGDLKLMIDWIAETGQSILQLLPVNDTTLTHTWTDSYPYSCVSIYALHPMYCDLHKLNADIAGKYEPMRAELNALKRIDYERVNKLKNKILKEIFDADGQAVLASAEYKKWFEEEQEWLVPYAQYCVLRDAYGTPDYTQWPDHNVWNEADRKALTSPRNKAFKTASFFYFVQYQLAMQMKEAHAYASEKGVVLKGDIPIGVNRQGSDSWMEPRYFNMSGQAGAPPDDFSANGQNWGFPTYNWEEMLKDDCAWWIRRFSNMAKYFDAYRIDHVLGFFRIWEIPVSSVHGLLGQFAPALGMTINEIQQYGLQWKDEYLEPYITDWVLERVFHDKAKAIAERYFDHINDNRYKFKEEFDTQRKIEQYFCDDNADDAVRDALYSLISNVLFLRDHKNPTLFHPRISAQKDTCFEALWDNDKQAFNNLYNDYFYHRNEHFWYLEAMKKLPRLVNATKMLVCAEDLGMVPSCVADVMNELRILSLEIQSMPKAVNRRFGKLTRNPYRSVCTISSHDTATLRMWWDEDEERTQDYYRTILHRGDVAPHPLPGWLARDIIYRHLACPSMLCILTLQDWLATDEALRLKDAGAERINIPANPRHYWRYRMHLDLEDLLQAHDFNYSIKGLITETNRL